MICFNRDKEPSDDLAKKLQSLLDSIEFDKGVYELETDTEFYQGVDVSPNNRPNLSKYFSKKSRINRIANRKKSK